MSYRELAQKIYTIYFANQRDAQAKLHLAKNVHTQGDLADYIGEIRPDLPVAAVYFEIMLRLNGINDEMDWSETNSDSYTKAKRQAYYFF